MYSLVWFCYLGGADLVSLLILRSAWGLVLVPCMLSFVNSE